MNSNLFLKNKYHTILSYTGLILFFGGILIFLPLFILIPYSGELSHSPGFIIPGFILSLLGLFFWRFFHSDEVVTLSTSEGGVVVILSWIIISFFSAFPFIIILKFNFTQGVFEAISGWTTTGLSIVDVTKAPHLILFWRSIMQFMGGAGLAIIMLSAITGIPGQGISIAEGKGDQLVPNIRKSTRIVIGIYTIYAIFGFIALWLVGMSPFDAINHSFTAISTGGFSTHPDSIGYWNSHSIEIIIIVLMILGNLNFMTAYLILKGKYKAIFRNGEIRLFVLLIGITSLILFFLCQNIYIGVSKTVRVAIFETITALTTTGFSSTVYTGWSPAGYLILIILMIIGGGTSSTAGGIKQYRIYILSKSVLWQIKQSLKPKSQVIQNYVWRGEQKYYIKDETVNKMAIFSFVYILVFFIGSAVLSFHGYSIRDSMFEYASALGTVGLSVGITNINAPGCILWLESVGMFLGRLEFLIVFITIAKIVKDTIRILKK